MTEERTPDADDIKQPQSVHLLILTPEEVLFEGEADWVEIPLHDGLVGIWPGHAPMIASLRGGQLVYQARGETRGLAVQSGILRVHEEGCAVLVGSLQHAENASDSDKEALFADLEQALQEGVGEQGVKDLFGEPRGD